MREPCEYCGEAMAYYRAPRDYWGRPEGPDEIECENPDCPGEDAPNCSICSSYEWQGYPILISPDGDHACTDPQCVAIAIGLLICDTSTPARTREVYQLGRTAA